MSSAGVERHARAPANATACICRYYAKKAIELDARQGEPVQLPDEDYRCELRYDAVGVAACIVPWNYPLLMASWKIAPCLAAGCSCVIKRGFHGLNPTAIGC